MDRNTAHEFTRKKLNEFGLNDWRIRVSSDPNQPFLGLCMHNDKCIQLNAHHIDIHPDKEVINTILHEVAHALVGPGHGHNEIWRTKATEIGCDNTNACSTLDLPAHVIDAIRSGAAVEISVEEKEIVQKIREVTHKVTRLQDTCPECGKVAKEVSTTESSDDKGNIIRHITLECFHIITRVIPRGTPFETMVSNGWKPEIAACKHQWNKNQCILCREFRLFDFQIRGAQFVEMALATQKGALIADDMGLGKTVQALAILKFHSKKYKRTMVVTKSAIKFQWFKQAIRWLGEDWTAQIISTSKDYLFPNLKLYIIPYDLLRRFKREKLHALGIKLVILDEVQQIKNPDSSRTQEVRKLVSANSDCKVIELSGTPWKNRGSEFFPALNLIDPIKFYSYQHYLDTWVEYYWEGAKKKMGGIKNVKRFREYTAGLVIRREYNEVMEEFPDINRMKLPVQLDAFSQSTYDDSESEFVAWYNEYVIGGEEDKISGIEILAQMARMRHITGLAKIPATLGFVEEFIEDTDKKLVIFVHHKDVGQILYSSLTDTSSESNEQWAELAQEIVTNGVKVFKYTSELGDAERFDMQEEFNRTPRAVMIASTLACGEGVDLQTCADCILHERQWNPQNEDQAAPGRFRRIGQVAKNINITNPEAEGTIDLELDAIVEGKRIRFHEAMNKGEAPVWNQTSFAKELAERIVAKHQEKNGGKTPTRSITRAAQLKKKFEIGVM
jgi:SNF2 family DNA or RNA helicase